MIFPGIFIHKLSFLYKVELKKYEKSYQNAESAFYSRIRIQKNRKLQEIRKEELAKMQLAMTSEQLSIRTLDLPEGPQFKTRIECIE
jgi:hypothetical protein